MRTGFTLPDGIRPRAFVARVVALSLTLEIIGAMALYLILRGSGAEHPLWSAVFHSISAFCTAGFGLYDDSFESLRGDVYLNIVLGLLSLCGAVGFIVLADYWRRLPEDGRSLASGFQAMSAITTVGFNTVPIGAPAPSSVFVLTVMMIIGASLAGTGGGIKSTTAAVDADDRSRQSGVVPQIAHHASNSPARMR